jgi:hypothetical protein
MAKQKSQVEKFREAAREAGTSESEDAFNATLEGLAKAPRAPKDAPDKPKRSMTDQEMRLGCLRAALEARPHDAIKTASELLRIVRAANPDSGQLCSDKPPLNIAAD